MRACVRGSDSSLDHTCKKGGEGNVPLTSQTLATANLTHSSLPSAKISLPSTGRSSLPFPFAFADSRGGLSGLDKCVGPLSWDAKSGEREERGQRDWTAESRMSSMSRKRVVALDEDEGWDVGSVVGCD